MFQFANEKYLWLLLIIPLLFGIYKLANMYRKKQLKRFGELEIINTLMQNLSLPKRRWKLILFFLSLIFLIIALARPQFGTRLHEVKTESVEIMIALDVSNSMLAKDIAPNRLERAKKAIERLINNLKDDRLGIIVFAGDAYVQLPITDDYRSARMFLNTISPDIVPKQGTAIGSAINLAARSFSSENKSSKVIIIITDGENHEDDPISAAQKANENGIIVHTIGMGLPEGKPVPGPGGSGFLKDKSGNVVISKLDEKTLKKIAEAGKGTYVRASNTNVGLDMITDEISKLEKTGNTKVEFAEYDEKFTLFAWIAFVLLLIEQIISETRYRRKQNPKLK
ncbi:MAG: VWA domain-containing protein [Bacteroidales bacterium]|jgi:Ca-activated chloride channel family protein|nr:VWA domain-containing protein [Bacteroidales bacterium]MDY0160184.1 VWA domain-containing protein [Bacteroidales bacterium]